MSADIKSTEHSGFNVHVYQDAWKIDYNKVNYGLMSMSQEHGQGKKKKKQVCH